MKSSQVFVAEVYHSELGWVFIDKKERVSHENQVSKMVLAIDFKETFFKISNQGLLRKNLKVLYHLCRIKC